MRIGVEERDAHPFRIKLEQQRPRLRLFLRGRSVVEDADNAVRVLAYVVLPFEPGTTSELEVAPPAAEAPEYTARAPVDLVGRPRVPRGDDQMPVRCDVDRVDVEVVEPGAGLHVERRLG